MQIVIDIPEEDYKNVSRIVDMGLGTNVDEAIKNGIPLPKGHGRLIDVDWMLNKMATTDAQPRTQNEYYAWDFAKALFKKAPTIIDADKESEDQE